MSALKTHVAVRRYVTAVVRRFVRNESDIEDVVQDTLLLAHRHRESFRGESQYSTWLYEVARTASLNYIRRSKRAAENASENAWALDRAVDPADFRRAVSARQELEIALGAAGEGTRGAYLQSLAGMSEGEIARGLGISKAAAKSRVHRARCAAQAALATG